MPEPTTSINECACVEDGPAWFEDSCEGCGSSDWGCCSFGHLCLECFEHRALEPDSGSQETP